MVDNTKPRLWPQRQNTPAILWAYLIFSLLATTLHFTVFFAPRFNQRIVPFTGWQGLGYYMFTLYFIIAALTTPQTPARIRFMRGVHFILGAAALIGIIDFWQFYGTPNFDNPYLTYSPWRPLITIALPLLWLALLISPTMKRWNNQNLPATNSPSET